MRGRPAERKKRRFAVVNILCGSADGHRGWWMQPVPAVYFQLHVDFEAFFRYNQTCLQNGKQAKAGREKRLAGLQWDGRDG